MTSLQDVSDEITVGLGRVIERALADLACTKLAMRFEKNDMFQAHILFFCCMFQFYVCCIYSSTFSSLCLREGEGEGGCRYFTQ